MMSGLDQIIPTITNSIRNIKQRDLLEECAHEFQSYLDKILNSSISNYQVQTNMFHNTNILNVIQNLVQTINTIEFLKPYEKELTISTFTKLKKIIQEFLVNNKIQIKINQTIQNIERDTLRQIIDFQDLLQLLITTKSCGKNVLLKQFDQYIRKLQSYVFFWENLVLLENNPLSIKITKDQLLNYTELANKIDVWRNEITIETTQNQGGFQKMSSLIQEQKFKIQNNHQLDKTIIQGLQFYSGLGLQQNKLKALSIFSMMAEQGNCVAQTILGQLIMEGQICEQNFDQAYQYFQMSADQQNQSGIYLMAKLILEGKVKNKIFNEQQLQTNDISQNEIEIDECQFAVTLLKLASEMGSVESMIYLGDLYFQGHKQGNFIIDIDYSQSELYYKEAIKNSYYEANYKLAKLYLKMSKIHVYKNRIQLVQQLLTEAKNNDYLPAYYDLAQLLYEGMKDEFKPNQLMAELIYEQGAIKGNKDCAIRVLEIKFKQLQNKTIELIEFQHLLDILDSKFSTQPITQFYRGKIFLEGIQTESNILLANQFLIQGANLGCQKCKLELTSQSKQEQPQNFENRIYIEKLQPKESFIKQVKQSDWRLRFKKQTIISQQQQLSQDNDLSTQQQARPTQSIIRTRDFSDLENRRNRVISDYTGFARNISEQSLLLSNIHLNLQKDKVYSIQNKESLNGGLKFQRKNQSKPLSNLHSLLVHSQSQNSINL